MDLLAPFTWALTLILKFMMWPLALLVILALILGKDKTLRLLKLLIGRKSAPPAELNYKSKGPLMSAAEQHFYNTLLNIAPADNQVMSKVRIADLIEPDEKGKRYKVAFNKISSKHIDFVVVNKETMEVVICIELNDKSHKRKDRKQRDLLLTDTFEKAQIPLLFYPVKRNYSEQDISKLINEKLALTATADEAIQSS